MDAPSAAKSRSHEKIEPAGFDIVGDVHGCADELEELLAKLGYDTRWHAGHVVVTSPPGRRAVFVGDLVDRGPRSPDVLRIVHGAVTRGAGLCVIGNHEVKLLRALAGRHVRAGWGLVATMQQLANEAPEFTTSMATWLAALPPFLSLDAGRLIVAHAGLRAELQGRPLDDRELRSACIFGETIGEKRNGLPVRRDWAADYAGAAMVVYGHTPVSRPEWRNRTISIDTGCVFGGRLTALRYPELELITVRARQNHHSCNRRIQRDRRLHVVRPTEYPPP